MINNDRESTRQIQTLIEELNWCKTLILTDYQTTLGLILGLDETKVENFTEIICNLKVVSNYEVEFLNNFKNLSHLSIEAHQMHINNSFNFTKMTKLKKLNISCPEKTFFSY